MGNLVGLRMKTNYLLILVTVLLIGCVPNRAFKDLEAAEDASALLIGLSKQAALSCLGIPDKSVTLDDTELWEYKVNVWDVYPEVPAPYWCKQTLTIEFDEISNISYEISHDRPTNFMFTSDKDFRRGLNSLCYQSQRKCIDEFELE